MKIRALLIGINDYLHVTPLRGTINDLNKVRNWLESLQSTDVQIEINSLENEEATRANVIDGVTNLFKSANKDIQTLFYFSGHGGLERAPKALAVAGQDLETLVCVDSRGNGIPDLADKEIRYLMSKYANGVSGENIVIITDSCHSAGVTRSVDANDSDLVPRLAPGHSKREWKDFLFASEIPESSLSKPGDLVDKIPAVDHIHLAACQSYESAYEFDRNGIFTSRMISILNQSPNGVSYRDLISRVTLGLRARFNQSPSLFGGNDSSVWQASFLGLPKVAATSLKEVNLTYNRDGKAWFIDRGAIHGLQSTDDITVELKLNASSLSGKLEIGIDKSKVSFKNDEALNRANDYKVSIPNYISRILQIGITGEPGNVKVVSQATKDIKSFNFTEDFSLADIIITATGGIISITWPDLPLPPQQVCPLILQYKTENFDSNAFLSDLQQIAQWMHVRDISNPGSAMEKNFPVDWLMYMQDKTGNETALKVNYGDLCTIDVPYTSAQTGKYICGVKNTTKSKLHFALLYLDEQFGIDATSFSGTQVVEPGENWLLDRKPISNNLPEHITKFNFPHEYFYYKLFVSTEPFSLDALNLSALEKPNAETFRLLSAKGMDLGEVKQPTEDWATLLIRARAVNPDYSKNKISIYMPDQARDAVQKENSIPCPEDTNEWDAAYNFQLSNNTGYVEPDLAHEYRYEEEIITGARGAKGATMPVCGENLEYLDNWPHPETPKVWHLDDEHTQLLSARKAVENLATRTVRIAHFDTGIDPLHKSKPKGVREDLMRSFIKGEHPSLAYEVRAVKAPNSPGHGTGTIGLLAGNRIQIEAAGFDDELGGASFAEVVPIRISNSVALVRSETFAEALEYVISLYDNPDTRCDIITMSMGGSASRRWTDAVNLAYSKGIFIVTAAGNNVSGLPARSLIYPARFKRVVAAAGANYNDQPYYKKFGLKNLKVMQGNSGPRSLMKYAVTAYTPNVPWPRIGCDAEVPLRGDGTSSATPQVAAAAACYLKKYATQLDAMDQGWKRVEAIRHALFSTARKNEHAKHNSEGISKRFGHGIIQVADALEVIPNEAVLEKTAVDTATVPELRVLFGTKGVDEVDPRTEMFEVEILQIAQRDPEIQDLLDEIQYENGDRDALIKLLEMIAAHYSTSDTLKAYVSQTLEDLN